MIGSTTPAAKQAAAEGGPPPIELYPSAWGGDAPRATARPVAITYSRSLNARLEALLSEAFEPAFTIMADGAPRVRPRLALEPAPQVEPSLDTDLVMPDVDPFSVPAMDSPGDDDEAFAAGDVLDADASELASQTHMRALVRDFHRRQRNASLLVAGSLATACVLTILGVVAVASFAKSNPRHNTMPLKHSTSVAWQPPQQLLVPTLARSGGDRDDAHLIPAETTGEAPASLIGDATLRAELPSAPTSVILVQAGRTLALAPLLPQRQARFLLLRGLLEQARLSTGQRNSSGAWIVKDSDIADLTLLVDEAPSHPAASGDYPIDIYLLGTGKVPQARQHLVLRVASGAGAFPATTAMTTSWPAALLDLALMSLTPDAKAFATKPPPLLARARRLIGEGDIAGARLLFLHLAEAGDGDGEAAYELARTFDAQVLAELGARGIDSDPTRARGWYERAAESGNAQATERLKVFASLAD